jgi:ribosomal protein S18 acetylase RimI-like enzyme
LAAIDYRCFRNADPPALVQVWNESMTSRGAAFLQGTTPLEYYLLAKGYFDPASLIVAEERGKMVGFALVGFGADSSGKHLNYESGIVSAVVVRPKYRRQGIGRELLHRGEAYLRGKGAEHIFLGGMRPLNPYFLGVYGGSELPGVLRTDTLAEPFLQSNQYEPWDGCVVMERSLDGSVNIGDPRFAGIRKRFEVRILPRPVTERWYDECVLAPLEVLQFQLQEVTMKMTVAQANVWDMDLFGWRWHQPAAGIIDVEVHPNCRRQGLGKFLLVQIIRYLQDQFFALVEVQAMQNNAAAMNMYKSLGFQKVDEGRVYRLKPDAMKG